MKYKDYYKILGLNGPKATDEEIRLAFRSLAKKYHPDINPNDLRALEKFKDVNEAYQVLTNEDEKRKFNMKYYAHSLKSTISINNIKDKIDGSGKSEFVEMFVGKQNVNKNIKKDKNVNTIGENIETAINLTLEEAFNGVSKKIQFKSTEGNPKTITVKIPTGIVNGGKIRIKGQGKPSKNGGNPGDLLIKINILEHKVFKLDKANLITEIPITPSEAVLGCDVNIECLDTMINLKIPAGTSTAESFTFNGKGYYDEEGNRGNLVATTKIVVPKDFSEKEIELYKKLQEITSFMPRKH